jgi:acetyltransferase-like isoleucine patch superfamily enzyme
MTPNLDPSELRTLGLGAIGTDVRIHRSVLFFGQHNVFIGNHVRIDCQAVIAAGEAGIYIGDHIHLAAGVYLFGSGGKVTLGDFCGLSARVCVYTASDDYVDGFLTGPTVPEPYKKLARGDVFAEKHVIVGAGSIILPGVHLGFGAAVGALTVVRKAVGPGDIVAGNPARPLAKQRDVARLRNLEAQLLNDEKTMPQG